MHWAPAVFWLFLLALFSAVVHIGDLRFDYDFAALEDSSLPSFCLDHEVNRILGYSQTPVVVLTENEDQERLVASELRKRKLEPGSDSTVDFVATVGFVLVFPGISLSDGVRVPEFTRELRGVLLPDGRSISASGEAMILADILDMVSREAPPVLGLTLVLVLLTLWLLVGRLGQTLLCLLPAAATLAATLGLLPLVDLRLNYLNIIMIPVLFGIGVDGGVHLVTRLRGDRGRIGLVLSETGRDITGAVLTTALGFGALLVADHPGLASLARLALLGLAGNLLACLVGLPALIALIALIDAKAPAPLEEGPAPPRPRSVLIDSLATVGWAGLSRLAPGTLGALIALPFGWLLSTLSWPVHLILLHVGAFVSIVVVDRYLVGRPDPDPREVVIDEFIGVLVALFFVPWEPVWVLAAFLLFRLLDIWKPGPIRWIDRRVHLGLGVVGDDLVAGLLAGLALAVLHRLDLVQGWWS